MLTEPAPAKARSARPERNVRQAFLCRQIGRRIDELHLHAGQLDHVLVAQWVRGRTEVGAVDSREHLALDMRDEVAGWPARDHGDLVAGTADGRERLYRRQFAARIGAAQDLDYRCAAEAAAAGAQRLRSARRSGSRT